MQTGIKKYWLFYLTLFLGFFTLIIVYFVWRDFNKQFTFAMLNVGQGDALFLESPTGIQILIDGGPPKKILSELPKVMSPFDKTLDAIIITNPDQDHIGGLIDILENYQVGNVFEPGTFNSSKTYQNLETEIKKQKIPKFLAQRGMVLNLGDNTRLEILFPDQDVSRWEINDGSIVAKLNYGETSIMLTGDATTKTEKIILAENSKANLQSDILKVGHHGSRTSTSKSFLEVISPKYALISDAKKNKYGHPHQEILDLLNEFSVKILRTDELGTIIIKCDNIETCKIRKLKN